MKKILSFALALVMLVGVIAGIDLSAYAGDTIFGYDFSEHNGVVSFTDAKEEGKDFVMIRLGYFNHLDQKFWENVEKAYKAKMNFGVYLYSYAYDLNEAEIEANFVLETLSDERFTKYAEYFTLPVAYDLEEEKMQKYGKKQITEQMTLFCDTIKAAGYVPMVYANLTWLTDFIDVNTIKEKDYRLWYAYWVESPDFSKPIQVGDTNIYADMWQYLGGEKDKYDENVLFDTDVLVKPLDCYHSYTAEKIEPTCFDEGYTIHTCKNCGNTYNTDYVKPHPILKSVVPATQTADGKIVETCTVCNKTISTTVIPKIASMVFVQSVLEYNGKTRTPETVIKDSKGNVLKEGTDYTVTLPKNRYNVGRYQANITFKGNYRSTATLYFNISPQSTVFNRVNVTSTDSFTVWWNKVNTPCSGYQVQFATKSDFSDAQTYTLSGSSNVSKKFTGLYKNWKYYVRVRSFVYTNYNGGNYTIYGTWSPAKWPWMTTATPKMSFTSQLYSGQVKTPVVTVTDTNGRVLKEGADYTVIYPAGRTNVGRYAVKVSYKGAYGFLSGQTLYFNIPPQSTTISSISSMSRGFKLVWNRQQTQTSGYQVQYATRSDFSDAKTLTFYNNSQNTYNVTGMYPGWSYYVRIRTYKYTDFNGSNYTLYSPWSAAKIAKAGR